MHILSSQRDMEVARTTQKGGGLSRKVARARPDVVVLGGDDPALAATLLEYSPRLKVLAVTEEGEDSWLYGLTPERRPLGPLSPARLVRAIRGALRPCSASAWWDR